MTSRDLLSLPVLLTVVVSLLMRLLSQAAPALAGSAREGIYVVEQGAATVARYLIEDGEPKYQDSVPAGKSPLSIALTPDMRYAYVADPKFYGIHLYEIGRLGKLTKRPRSGKIIDPTIFEPSRFMVIHASGKQLILGEYDTSEGTCIPVCAPPKSWLSTFTIYPDGYLVQGSDKKSGQIPRAMAGTPDGTKLYVANQGNNTVCTYNTNASTGDVTGIYDCVSSGGNLPESLKVSPSSKYFVVANRGNDDDGNVTAFKIMPGVPSKIGSWRAGKAPVDIAFHPSAPFAAVVSYDDYKLHLFRIMASGEMSKIGDWPTGTHPASVAFASSSKLIFTANVTDGSLSVFAFDETTARVTPRGSVQIGSRSGPIALAVFTLQDTAALSSRAFAGEDAVSLSSKEDAEEEDTEEEDTTKEDAPGNPGWSRR